MSDVKKEQLSWLVVAAFFTAGMLWFMKDTSVATGIAWTFVGIIGTFIGVDLAVMLKKTAELPEGKYKEINKNRYIISLVIFALLLVEAFVLSGLFDRQCDGLYASFGMGFLVVIGGLVTGVEANKAITGTTEQPGSEAAA
jgi:hypothetical protein